MGDCVGGRVGDRELIFNRFQIAEIAVGKKDGIGQIGHAVPKAKTGIE
jgi:hypothetical protein